jgi:hypothetical protein
VDLLKNVVPDYSSDCTSLVSFRKRVLQDLRAPGLYLLPSIAVGDSDFEVLQINLCTFRKSTRSRRYIKTGRARKP